MISNINYFLDKHEKNISIMYIFIFCLAIFFTFSFRKGIEFTRYGLIALTVIILFLRPKYLKKILTDSAFLILFVFITISTISLIYNNASLGKIDDAFNWALCYIFGFIIFRILKANTLLILYAIPIFLFLCQVLYPFFAGTLIDNLNFLSGKRLDQFFIGKPIHLGIFAGISTFTGLYIFLKSNHKYTKLVYSILTLSSFLVLLSTGTRTSFVGTTITIAIMLICLFYRKNRLSYLAITGLSILTIASLFMLFKNEARISSLADSEKVTDAFLERELIFILAKDSFLRSPIIGEGFDRFSEIYHENVNKYSQEEDAKEKYAYILTSTNNAHNFSLHFLTETGILGFLCMNAFWILIIRNGLKHDSHPAKIISGIFLLSYIAFQFNMSLYGTQLSTLLFSLAGLSSAAIQGSKDDEFDIKDNANFPLIELKAFK